MNFGRKRFEGIVLGNLGNIYSVQGHYQKAIAHFEDSLVILKEIQASRAQVICLHNLADAYRCWGYVSPALEYYHTALEMAQEIGDRRLEAILRGKLCCIELQEKNNADTVTKLEEICRTCQELNLPQQGYFYLYLARRSLKKNERNRFLYYLDKGKTAVQRIPEYFDTLCALGIGW